MSNNLETKKRIFEILNKLSSGYDFKASTENFDTSNDIFDLVSILTNNNPYKKMQPVTIYLTDTLDGNPNTLAMYHTNKQTISYSLPFIKALAENNANFMMLLDTIYHEQQHHNQDFYRTNPELIKNIDFKEIADGLLDENSMTDSEIEELHNFATQHHLIHLKVPTSKLIKLQLGSYLSKKCEIDARNTAFNDTTETFKMMIEDELCSPTLKQFLTKSYKTYANWQMQVKSINQKSMKSFERLDKKVKSNLMRAIKSDKKLDDDTYNALLNGILDYISKHSTLQENLEIAEWALKHNYLALLHRMNLRNSLNHERDDLSKFIDSIVSKNLLTSSTFTHVCHLFSTFSKQTNDDAINYLVENLADRANADILLDNSGLSGGITFFSKYITPKTLDVALSNYLSKIEHTKTITNYTQYLNIQQKLHNILSNVQANKQSTAVLLNYIKRFDMINADPQIKIVKNTEQEKEKEETLGL